MIEGTGASDVPSAAALSPGGQSESVAIQLIEAVLPLLLRYRIGYEQLSLAARGVLVNYAAQVARLKNGRANQSQIAAATGLSRAEVRRHLVGHLPDELRKAAWRSKTSIVLNAWISDKRFCFAQGKPRPLSLKGRGATFETLVRDYGRDIPPKAMEAELRRQGCILVKEDIATFRKDRRKLQLAVESVLSARIAAISAIAAAPASAVCQPHAPIAQFVSISAADEIERNLVLQRVRSIVESSSAALADLQASPVVNRQKRTRRAAHELRVAIVVSEAEDMTSQKVMPRSHRRTSQKRKGPNHG